MIYILAFIILLGVLIFVHEIGHFLVAKYFGIKVEVFSLGFGHKILKKKWGETEYCISVIPFGGYVKLYGDDPTAKVPDSQRHRSFSEAPASKRFLIVAAGPIFNLVLAIVIFGVIALTGEPQISSYIADVKYQSQAWKAGFRPGDRITSINDNTINTYPEIQKFIEEAGPKLSSATVLRGNSTISIPFTPKVVEKPNIFREMTPTPSLDGFSVISPAPVVGISNPNSLAAKAGFKTGDHIVSINGVPIERWSILREYLINIAQTDLHFVVKSDEETYDLDLNLPKKYFQLAPTTKLSFLGLHSSSMFIDEVSPDTPAFIAGMKAGDRIISINDDILHSWDDFRETVQTFEGDAPLAIKVERQGNIETFTLKPRLEEHRTPIEGKRPEGILRIGAISQLEFGPVDMYTFSTLNPVKIVSYAFTQTWHWFYLTCLSVYKLVTGQVPLQAIGGPIFIGSLAGSSLQQGFYYFIRMMAIISVNLGFINLLPIPVLDGGHLVFFGWEMIRRKPLSLRMQTIAQQIGIAILLLLMVVVMFNDVRRYWGNLMDYFTGLF
ncbi:RIP metalloprotease RseP [Bdellovibrionota bacterium]